MSKSNSYGLSKDLFTNTGSPTTVALFRDQTAKMIPYNFKTKLCPVCKKTRSLTQFKEGRTACIRCPEPKE